jgi:hypothetical protein
MLYGGPETFSKVFNRVFGASYLSWRCLYASIAATILTVVMTETAFDLYFSVFPEMKYLAADLSVMVAVGVFLGYGSVTLTRIYISQATKHKSVVSSILLSIGVFTSVIIVAVCATLLMVFLRIEYGPVRSVGDHLKT